MRNRVAKAIFGLLAASLVAGAARAENGCSASDAGQVQLRSPLIKSNDDAIAMAQSYYRMATDQRDMFDKRKYTFEVARAGEVWTTSIIFMRRPRYIWEDWKRRGRVGKVVVCGYDGHLMSFEKTY